MNKKIVSWPKLAAAFVMVSGIFLACQKEIQSPSSLSGISELSRNRQVTAPYTGEGYTVELASRVWDGTYTTFTWKITNTDLFSSRNPGGLQDLSHWNLVLCDPTSWSDIVSASYGPSASNLTAISPRPAYQPDPSQECYDGSVFKFDYGTKGAVPTFYQLKFRGNYPEGQMTVYFKSGSRTQCLSKVVRGVGCEITEYCSLSQGYWFARPITSWEGLNTESYVVDGNVVIGGKSYTQEEGKAIWNTSNKGGIRDSKKGFLQVSAIYLSMAQGKAVPTAEQAPELWNDIAIVEAFLVNQSKLSPTNLPNDPSGVVGAAAGRIGDWINANHCD